MIRYVVCSIGMACHHFVIEGRGFLAETQSAQGRPRPLSSDNTFTCADCCWIWSA